VLSATVVEVDEHEVKHMSKMRSPYGDGGFSYSSNAMLALGEGRMSMTAAKKAVAETAHITQVKARRILELTHDGEWHHVSKYANRVKFYDVRKAVAWGRLLRRYAKLVQRNGTFTTSYYYGRNNRRIIHWFFEQEKGIGSRSMAEGRCEMC
jgi:hypothetical protein